MPSVKQIIDGHNKAILKKAQVTTPQRDEGKKCNCRKKEDCPLNGECMVDEVVYQATATPKTQQKHTSASQRTTSRQGMGTITCPLDTKREKVRLN